MLSVMRRTAVLALTAVAVGCSLPDVEPMPGEAPPSTVATPLATPWKSTSQRIEILTSELNSARSPIYVKDRARLSEEQLAALAQMRFVTYFIRLAILASTKTNLTNRFFFLFII